jgi:hypothetical protein
VEGMTCVSRYIHILSYMHLSVSISTSISISISISYTQYIHVHVHIYIYTHTVYIQYVRAYVNRQTHIWVQ